MEEIFPPEIFTDILLRLPVESLLRFRCVSKPWCALIDDPSFIKNHLKYSKQNGSSLNVIISDSISDSINWVSFDSFYNNLKMSNLCFDLLDFCSVDNPFKDKFMKLIGSCDGLLCFSNVQEMIFLMNPCTREDHILPIIRTLNSEFLLQFSVYGVILFGFGYDPISDDYKVIRLKFYQSNCREKNLSVGINVYSLESNSWRLITLDVPFGPYYYKRYGVLLYDTLHWPATRYLSAYRDSPLVPELIMGFDLGVEEFRELPMVRIENQEKIFYVDLGVVEECVSAFAMYKGTLGLDIWVMTEYGVKESWTRLYSVALNGAASCMKTLAFSKDSDQLLLGARSSELLCYNLMEEHLKIMETGINMAPIIVGTFQESRIPINLLKGVQSSRGRKLRKRERIDL